VRDDRVGAAVERNNIRRRGRRQEKGAYSYVHVEEFMDINVQIWKFSNDGPPTRTSGRRTHEKPPIQQLRTTVICLDTYIPN
jgi:hypothetical protein